MNEKEYDEQMEKMKQVGMVAFANSTDESGFMPVFISLLFKYGMTSDNVGKMLHEMCNLLEKEGKNDTTRND